MERVNCRMMATDLISPEMTSYQRACTIAGHPAAYQRPAMTEQLCFESAEPLPLALAKLQAAPEESTDEPATAQAVVRRMSGQLGQRLMALGPALHGR